MTPRFSLLYLVLTADGVFALWCMVRWMGICRCRCFLGGGGGCGFAVFINLSAQPGLLSVIQYR